MAQLYQWTVPCTTCESPVQYHCNTCGDVLCPRCKNIHLKSNAGRNHDVVPYSQRMKPNKSCLQCGDHPGHRCTVWCQTCNKRVCEDCVTSPKHRGHHFLRFDEMIEEKRKEIQGQFDRCSKTLSDWKALLQNAEKMKEKYEVDVKQLDREIIERADEICKQVRAVERKSRRRLQKMKDSSLRILKDHQQSLTDGIERLKKKIKDLEDTLRSNETSTILKCQGQNVTDARPFPIQAPTLPVFVSGYLDVKVLNDMFGNLSERGIQGAMPDSQQNKQMTLLSKPSVEAVMNIIESNLPISAIACVGSGQAWVQTGWKVLQQLDREGTVKRTVNTDFNIEDLAVTPHGDILLLDLNNRRVMFMSIGRRSVKTLFSTKWTPWGICCLPSGDIVVAFRDDKRVIQYSSAGKIIREMDRSMFQYPWYVTYSQVNCLLYVCDKSNSKSSDASGRVLAIDMKSTLQYTYTGSDTRTLTPAGLCTDLLGHVLITDYKNDRVHIIDKRGNFLQYLLTKGQGLTRPITIDVDSDGYAWIGGLNSRELKVVKYINTSNWIDSGYTPTNFLTLT